MFAIIATGGKQYRVKPGDIILVEKLPLPAEALAKAGVAAAGKGAANFEFDQVLLAGEGEQVTIGAPTVLKAKVTAKVLEAQVKAEKKLTFKYTHKTRYKRKVGHRQRHTRVQIEKIAL